VFPNIDVTGAVVDDNLWAGGASGIALARFQTTGGSVLTAARVSREHEQLRRRGRLTNAAYYYAQPAWSDQPLAIPEQEIACCGYREADEAPLSLFPAETLVNRRLIGQPAPWSANRSPSGGFLATGSRESDLGIAAHGASSIAFDLPAAAKTLELAVGLDRAVGAGGCVRCRILGGAFEGARALWDSGILEGKSGLKDTGPLDVTGLRKVLLVTEFAHADRPPGADPLDVRDEVVWLSPLVRLDLSGGAASRALAVLPGAADWQLAGDGWKKAQIASRWNLPANSWDPVVALPKGANLRLTRTLRLTRANDVVELLTVCPLDLDEHDFALQVNGREIPWHNNADRNQLRQWTLRHSRTRARDGDEESNLTDRLAYWWDLQQWRGEEVTLDLTIRGSRERSEIAWRGLSVRSAIGNLPAGGEPIVPDVSLASLEKSPEVHQPPEAPTRFLGQLFPSGYALPRSSSVTFELEPKYKKFVAVVGCTLQVAGPVQVLMDGRVIWERAAINSLTPAEQVEIAIPDGVKAMTLRSGSEGLYYGTAAFAEAGFVTK
jgi:hypothetical protein